MLRKREKQWARGGVGEGLTDIIYRSHYSEVNIEGGSFCAYTCIHKYTYADVEVLIDIPRRVHASFPDLLYNFFPFFTFRGITSRCRNSQEYKEMSEHESGVLKKRRKKNPELYPLRESRWKLKNYSTFLERTNCSSIIMMIEIV